MIENRVQLHLIFNYPSCENKQTNKQTNKTEQDACKKRSLISVEHELGIMATLAAATVASIGSSFFPSNFAANHGKFTCILKQFNRNSPCFKEKPLQNPVVSI